MVVTRFCFAALIGSSLLMASACAWRADDKCYLSMNRYRDLRAVYLETNSMQRVEQIMTEERWTQCERRQFRYLLEKDLHLDDPAGMGG